jgi:hypothetical protein
MLPGPAERTGLFLTENWSILRRTRTVARTTAPQCENSPQVCVDWCDAFAFCHAMGKRLCGALSGGSAPYDHPSAGEWPLARSAAEGLQGCDCHGMAGGTDVATIPECAVYYDGQSLYGNVSEWEDSSSAERNRAATDDLARRPLLFGARRVASGMLGLAPGPRVPGKRPRPTPIQRGGPTTRRNRPPASTHSSQLRMMRSTRARRIALPGV